MMHVFAWISPNLVGWCKQINIYYIIYTLYNTICIYIYIIYIHPSPLTPHPSPRPSPPSFHSLPFHLLSQGTLESDPSQRYIVSTGPGVSSNPPEMLLSSTKRLLHVENIGPTVSTETKGPDVSSEDLQRSVVIDIGQTPAPKQGSGHPPPREKWLSSDWSFFVKLMFGWDKCIVIT